MFKKSISRKLNEGTIGQEVHTKIRYKKKKKPIKLTLWQKIIKYWERLKKR